MYEYVLTLFSAVLASYFTNVGLQNQKYKSLNKPSWFPPGYLFGIAWTIIYILFAISWSRVSNISTINYLYMVNLLFNVLWCFMFFYSTEFNLSLFILLGLNVILLAQIILVYKYDLTATLMLVPYFLWTLFASYLNYSINKLN